MPHGVLQGPAANNAMKFHERKTFFFATLTNALRKHYGQLLEHESTVFILTSLNNRHLRISIVLAYLKDRWIDGRTRLLFVIDHLVSADSRQQLHRVGQQMRYTHIFQPLQLRHWRESKIRYANAILRIDGRSILIRWSRCSYRNLFIFVLHSSFLIFFPFFFKFAQKTPNRCSKAFLFAKNGFDASF